MRKIKFRIWNGESIEETIIDFNIDKDAKYKEFYIYPDDVFMQFTGLKDKNGVEIYEYMEIDNTYEVSFLNGSYVLTNISNGDIMLLSNYMENNNGKVEITREYTKV